MTVKLDIPALVDDCTRAAAYIETREPALGSEAYRYADVFRQAASALTTALEIGRAMGIEQAAKYHDVAARDIRAAVDAPNFDGNERLHLEAIADHEIFADHIRALSPAVDLEGLTERIEKIIDDNVSVTDSDRDPWVTGTDDAAVAVLASFGLRARESA